MKKALKILLIVLSLCIALFILFIGIIYYQWATAPNPRAEQRYFESQYKSIWFENKFNRTYFFIEINFEYTSLDSLSYTESKMDSIIPFSKLDSVMLNYYPSDKTSIMIPILSSDSAKFPKTFCVKIYNEDKSKLLKELDFNSFMKHSIAESISDENNPLVSSQWTLVVDSTLLDLKK